LISEELGSVDDILPREAAALRCSWVGYPRSPLRATDGATSILRAAQRRPGGAQKRIIL
jgi:hypothetical protein